MHDRSNSTEGNDYVTQWKSYCKKTYYISSLKNKLHNIDEDYEKRYEKAFSLHGLFIIRGEDAATRRLLI